MFGISEEQLSEFGMTFGLGAFMLFMLFIIGSNRCVRCAGQARCVPGGGIPKAALPAQ